MAEDRKDGKMVLADNELRSRLDQLRFETSNPNFAFNADKQIQPCSIDIRLDEVFWVPKGWRRIELSDRTPLGPQITSAYRRTRMSFPDGYLLRPGRTILARTYEKFSIPSDLMGLLIPRSSIGRLGLLVCSAVNFMNPDWRGHMPLVITNNSPFAVRLQPYLGIVQLCLIGLSSTPARTYGHAELDSKYLDDDGGPSRYWRDHTIKALHENRNAIKADAPVVDALERFANLLDEPIRKRFLDHIKRYGVVSDLRPFLERFLEQERARNTWLAAVNVIAPIVAAAVIGAIPLLMGGSFWIAALLAILTLVLVAWQLQLQMGSGMSNGELLRIINETTDR